MNQHKTSMKSYRKWGEPTIYNGYVMDVKCFFVEDMEEFMNLRGDKKPLCGIGSIAVVPSTGEIYYLSYENGWKLWGGESDSGEDDHVDIDFVKDGKTITLQKTWAEIKELFDAGTKLYAEGKAVQKVYSSDGVDETFYLVETLDNQGTPNSYLADSEDDYPSREIGEK